MLFVQRQSRYMQEYPCGYDKENLAVVNIRHGSVGEEGWLAAERLKLLPEVLDVAYASELLGGSDTYSTSTEDFGKGAVEINVIFCSWNLPDVLGLKVTEGKPFFEGAEASLLMTEDLRQQGVEVGMKLEAYGLETQGLVNSINITSMRKADTPVAFVAYPVALDHAYLRLAEGVDRRAATDKILAVPTLFVWRMRNLGEVRMTGVDLSAGVNMALVGPWRMRGEASWSWMKAVDLSDPTAKNYGHQIPYSPLHSGSASLSVISRRLSLQYTLIAVGKRYFQPQNIEENLLPAYLDQNLSLRWEIPLRGMNLSLGAEVLNLGGVQYEIVRSYPMPSRQLRLSMKIQY